MFRLHPSGPKVSLSIRLSPVSHKDRSSEIDTRESDQVFAMLAQRFATVARSSDHRLASRWHTGPWSGYAKNLLLIV